MPNRRTPVTPETRRRVSGRDGRLLSEAREKIPVWASVHRTDGKTVVRSDGPRATSRLWLTPFLDCRLQRRKRMIVAILVFTATRTTIRSVAQPAVPASPATPQRFIDLTTKDDAQYHG
jgi:hypothetical protein